MVPEKTCWEETKQNAYCLLFSFVFGLGFLLFFFVLAFTAIMIGCRIKTGEWLMWCS